MSAVCLKCKKMVVVESAVFCPYCGASMKPRTQKKKVRGNGEGSAYKIGSSWAAAVSIGFTPEGHIIRRVKRGFKTKAEAVAYIPTLRSLSDSQRDQEQTFSFSEIYERWRELYKERITQSTMTCYASAYKHFAQLHSVRFLDVRVADLQQCIDDCPAGKRTKENMKALASLVYQYAMSLEIIFANKATTLYTGNDATTTREAFSTEELELIRTSDDPYAAYVLAMCYTGFRPGEFLGLQKSSYDPVHNCLIGGSKTKAGKDRNVPISPKIQHIFQERMASSSEWLFPRIRDGKRMTDANFRDNYFNPLMEKLGITGKVPYSCRHTFANLLKNVKGSNTDKAALIGHSDTSMTEYYQDADYESLQKIIDSI